jgi:hypothetical protein
VPEVSNSTRHDPPVRAEQQSRRGAILSRVRLLVRAISDGDEASVQAAVVQLSRTKRILAPLGLAAGAIVMLFQGLKLLFSDWRLSLIQILPAMWIWAAMLDLKLHVVGKREFRSWYGTTVILVILAVAAVSVASCYLNAVFAFAISHPGKPAIGPAFTLARRHLAVVGSFGFAVGVALGYSIAVVPRWGLWWFAFSMSVVVAVMMLTYVTVPSRLVGLKANLSRRDKLAASVVAGTVGAIVCTPPYLVGRVGIVMLGSHALFIPGIILIAVGFGLQSGATGAVKAVKMSSKLVASNAPLESPSPETEPG